MPVQELYALQDRVSADRDALEGEQVCVEVLYVNEDESVLELELAAPDEGRARALLLER